MSGNVQSAQSGLSLLVVLASGRAGSDEYFFKLLGSKDEYVRVGALLALLDRSRDISTLPSVGDSLMYGAVRSRLLMRAKGLHVEYLEQISNVSSPTIDALRTRRMLAELQYDRAGLEAASGELYLATGLFECLLEASEHAESHGGWRAAVSWVVRAMVIAPLDPRGFARLYSMLSQARQIESMSTVADALKAGAIHPQIETVFRAGVAQGEGRHDDCLGLLAPLLKARGTSAIAPLLGSILQLSAVSEEKRMNFTAAYGQYQLLNQAGRSPTIDARDFYKAAEARERIVVPKLPPADRADIVQMTGFPRSGTTLLENVLAAHPAIETFEEIPALQAAYSKIERASSTVGPQGTINDLAFLAARKKYFDEIESRRRKAGARLLVDKMPLRSVESAFLNKLFPDWRYVFSIRHPFDVALSCFKQRFQPNVAMENFRTIEDTARLYDFAMNQWFGQFSMDSERACYVRYEDLVLDFEPTVRRVLDFLGVDWNDEVVSFARAAENRAARTPSYQKVRQGLSIGVQTSWRDYRFVFDSKAADPLRKWVDFFGYEAT